MLRLRAGALMDATPRPIAAEPASSELVPGIRSLQIGFDPDRAAPARSSTWSPASTTRSATSPTWRSRAASCDCRCRGTTRRPGWRPSGTCRASAPMRRGVRGTSSSSGGSTGSTRVDDVKRIVFDASYLVLGLGDVYLGAPVATPIDPRHRLVTTKYNPARTWTAENSVGIGGSYLCIYGMEGPGGYQFVGRTVPIWDRWGRRSTRGRRPSATGPTRRGCCASSIRSAGTRSAPTSCSTCGPTSRPASSRSTSSRRPSRWPTTCAISPRMRTRSREFTATRNDGFEAERRRWAAGRHRADRVERRRADRCTTSRPVPDGTVAVRRDGRRAWCARRSTRGHRGRR